jgi:hypothetical protein
MKIPPVGTELFHAEGKTVGHDKINSGVQRGGGGWFGGVQPPT